MSLPSEPIKQEKSADVNPADSFYQRPDVVLLDEKQWKYIKRRYHISPRELEVAKLVCRGYINGDIASKLNVKPGTVKTHLKSIFAKTHARNKITLLLRFMEDVHKFFGVPPSTSSVSSADIKKPLKIKPALDETLKKN